MCEVLSTLLVFCAVTVSGIAGTWGLEWGGWLAGWSETGQR